VPLTPSTRLGPYEIVAPIGAGGMGEVYRARDPRLGRDVALKVLPSDVAASPDRLARFEREARTVAALNHPNIVVLHSIEQDGDTRFITMELVEGQTLSALIAHGGMPLAKVLELAIPLADALVAAHEKGVIHRDLKPGNVMATRDGRVKVLDFGLAKLAQTESGDMTQAATMAAPISGAGQVVGTVPYMAPEQIRGGDADARSDLFALGVILYELVSGRRPFTGETQVDVSHAILHDTPEPLTDLRSDLPAELERIVGRCLEKNARERFQTALDLSNELRRLRRSVESGAQTAAEKPARDNVASIAVLPFVNRSASADDEYFSDGLADELLGVLAKIRGLRVSARASSFHFKGKDVPLAEVGKALNVATVLDGSVRKAGNRVRISVQLVKVADGYHLWSETYDRTLDDIFAVQDDIAQSVVKELRTTLLGEEAGSDASGQAKAEVADAAKGRGTDPEAHRLYLLARHLLDRYTPVDGANAIEYLRRALDLDPGFALAWTELARAYLNQVGRGWIASEEGWELTVSATERALALEPDLAEGHVRRAWIRVYRDWDLKGAAAACARALELAPGSPLVLRTAGMVAANQMRYEQSIGMYRRALELDPLAAPCFHNLMLPLLVTGRLDEAEDAARKALELAPQRPATRRFFTMVRLAQGRKAEALEEALRETDEEARLTALAIAHHALGQRVESDAALQQLIDGFSRVAALQVAEVYAYRGETDAAFEWLERAFTQRDPGMVEIRALTAFAPIHGDPRWTAFLTKLGFES